MSYPHHPLLTKENLPFKDVKGELVISVRIKSFTVENENYDYGKIIVHGWS